MATVRVSDKLVGQVVEGVGFLYRKFFDDIEKQKPDVGDRLYELLYGPYLSTMETLPHTFFRKMDRIETRSVGEKQLGLSFKLSAAKLGSYNHPPGEHVEASDYGDKVNIKRTPLTEEIVDAILSWRSQIDEINVTRELGQKAMRKLFKTYASLPPIIKMFPPVVDLIPAETKRKMDIPQHRLSSVAMELDPVLKRLATDIALTKILHR